MSPGYVEQQQVATTASPPHPQLTAPPCPSASSSVPGGCCPTPQSVRTKCDNRHRASDATRRQERPPPRGPCTVTCSVEWVTERCPGERPGSGPTPDWCSHSTQARLPHTPSGSPTRQQPEGPELATAGLGKTGSWQRCWRVSRGDQWLEL